MKAILMVVVLLSASVQADTRFTAGDHLSVYVQCQEAKENILAVDAALLEAAKQKMKVPSQYFREFNRAVSLYVKYCTGITGPLYEEYEDE